MNDCLNITQTELYLKSILSATYRNWTEHDIKRRPDHIIKRNADVFVCVIDGESIYEVDNKPYHLSAGDVIYLSNGCSYRHLILSEQYKNIYIDFLFDVHSDTPLPCVAVKGIDGITQSFIKLHRKWTFRSPSYQSDCMSILYAIYSRIIHAETFSYIPNAKRELFTSAVRTIADNYANEELSVSLLASQAGISEVHFRRYFRKIYHVSPQQYIMELRITNAKERLQYHSMPINEIAQVSGFSDPCYFSRIFKQKTGYTPSEYRKVFGRFS